MCKTEIEPQIQKTNIWLSKRKGEGDKSGVWDYHMHATIYEIDNQQGPAVCTWNYTQHFTIIYKGKESEKVYICVYIHTHIN